MKHKNTTGEGRIRFAIYTRISSDMQSDLSLETQEQRCRQEIAKRGGAVADVFSDSAKSGWSLDRDGFNDLRASAEHGKFDAVMFWKFDRLARNHEHSVMIKLLLRKEYGLKLYCVEGFSEDDDNDGYSALMEQMLAVFAAFYSRNLSSESKRGKRQRAINGEFNGSISPLGYDLVTVSQASVDRPAGLHINLRQAAIVRRAFRHYSTGNYSDADIADWMNSFQYIQRLRQGRKPINKEMIRELLQNRVYTGRVPHSDTIYQKTLGEGRESRRGRIEWFEGKHQWIVSDELFELCQQARKSAAVEKKRARNSNIYVLRDRVICARCMSKKPSGLQHETYGRMRPTYHNANECAYYRCIAKINGYPKCGQKAVRATTIDDQVVNVLSSLQIPDNYRERIELEVNKRIEGAAAAQRMEEIQQIITRLDLRWDEGFVDRDEYLEKRRLLQSEYEALRPIDLDELQQAADLLTNFRTYWDECSNLEKPEEARQQLVAKIVEHIYVYDTHVVALVLYGDFAIVLGENKTASPQIREAVSSLLQNLKNSVISSHFGDDGVRIRPCTIYVLYLHSNKHGLILHPTSARFLELKTTVMLPVVSSHLLENMLNGYAHSCA